MSNEIGKGWVELEFAEPQTDRPRRVGPRSRRDSIADRLATDYRIEVADASRRVANGRRRDGSRSLIRLTLRSRASLSTRWAQRPQTRSCRAARSREETTRGADSRPPQSANVAFAGTFPHAGRHSPAHARRSRAAERTRSPPPCSARSATGIGRRTQPSSERRHDAGRLDREPATIRSPPRDGEPHLAGAFRHRPGRHAPATSAAMARSRRIPNCSTGWRPSSFAPAGRSSTCTG